MSGLARVREGTEILRTGGGVTLTADECNNVIDEVEVIEGALDLAIGDLLEAEAKPRSGPGPSRPARTTSARRGSGGPSVPRPSL